MCWRNRQRVPLVGTGRVQTRIEHHADGRAGEDIGCTADVVALRVREHDSGEPTYAECPKLRRDICLGVTLADEHGALWHLQQRGIPLSHV